MIKSFILFIGFASLLLSCKKDEISKEYLNLIIDSTYYDAEFSKRGNLKQWRNFILSEDKKKAYIHLRCDINIYVSLILCDSVRFDQKIYYLNGGTSKGLLYTDFGDFSTDKNYKGKVEITT